MATLAILGGTACGKVADKVGDKALEKTIEAGSDGKVDIDRDGGSFNIETEDGSLSMDVDEDGGGMNLETDEGSFSTGSDIPDEWPDDIAFPPEFEVNNSHSVSGEDEATMGVGGRVGASPEEVVSFYQDGLSDWEEVSSSRMGDGDGEMHNITWENGGRHVALTVMDGDEGGSDLNLVHTEGGD